MVIPTFLHKLPVIDMVVPNIVNIAKTLFVGHLIETPLNHVSPTDMRMVTKVSNLLYFKISKNYSISVLQ